MIGIGQGAVTCEEPGRCHSCWAFSMTDALEGVLAVDNGWTQTMFEQQILDCNTWSSGCQGGTQRQIILLAVQLRHDLREGWRGYVVTKELPDTNSIGRGGV